MVMVGWYNLFKKNWWDVLEDRFYGLKFLVNLLVCYGIYMYVTRLLVANRFREGVVLHDVVQDWFTPMQFSIPIFVLTYTSIVAFLVYVFARPRDLYFGLRAFLLVFILRYSFIYLIPLAPSKTMIPLVDPVLDWIVGNNQEIYNDLFFSGHVADICIFIFCCRYKPLQYFLIASVFAVGLMLVWQHVHYTADVLGAPFFAYGSYVLVAKKGIGQRVQSKVAATQSAQLS